MGNPRQVSVDEGNESVQCARNSIPHLAEHLRNCVLLRGACHLPCPSTVSRRVSPTFRRLGRASVSGFAWVLRVCPGETTLPGGRTYCPLTEPAMQHVSRCVPTLAGQATRTGDHDAHLPDTPDP